MAAYHFHCMYLQWLISFQILLPKPYPSIEIPSFPNYIRYINIKVNSITFPDMNMEKNCFLAKLLAPKIQVWAISVIVDYLHLLKFPIKGELEHLYETVIYRNVLTLYPVVC